MAGGECGGVQQTEPNAVIGSESSDIYSNILGDDPVNKDTYNVTFSIETNGQQKTWTYPIPQTVSGTQAVNSFDFYPTFIEEAREFVKADEKAQLVGWTIYTDGHNTGSKWTKSDISYVREDACTYDTNYNNNYYGYDEDNSLPKNYYQLKSGRDYHFVAQIAKAAASNPSNLYITTIPSVYYDGREHAVLGSSPKSAKKTAADLRLMVYHGYGGYSSGSRLYLGTDYKVSYKNNKAASMTLVRGGNKAGTYQKKWTSNSERPTVTVTGIGKYKGFSADVYFDILPADLGAREYRYDYIYTRASDYVLGSRYHDDYTGSDAAEVSGIANSYLLKDVKKIKPKVTKAFFSQGYRYDSKTGYYELKVLYDITVKLVQGRDFNFEIYRWNSDSYTWTRTKFTAPSQISSVGNYLCLVRGIGNYCGAKYGYSAYDNMFNVGGNGESAYPWKSTVNSQQFVVTNDDSGDIEKAKVSIKKKTQKYVSDATTYDASDFKITVKNKKGKKLTLGTDYKVYFEPVYSHGNQTADDVTDGQRVSAANLYDVKIEGIGCYYGSKIAGEVKITGIKLKAGYFSYKKKVKLGEAQSFSLSRSGISAGIDLNDPSNPCYVSCDNDVIKSSKKQIQYAYTLNDQDYGSCGTAIYPAKTLVLKWTRKLGTVDINTAIANGSLKITPGEARFNAGGAFPDLTVNYYENYDDDYVDYVDDSGYRNHYFTGDRDVYEGASIAVYIKDYGIGYLNFSATNNKTVGTGKLTVTGTGALKGRVSFDYTIGTRRASYINRYPLGDVDDYPFVVGNIYSRITDRPVGTGDFTDTDVVLYQCYREKDEYKVAEISSDYYNLTGTPIGAKGIAWNITATDGVTQGLSFGREFNIGTFGLYEKEASVNDVRSVATIYLDQEYARAVADGKLIDYTPKFSGVPINPLYDKITMNDGTVIANSPDAGSSLGERVYGENLTAGTVGTMRQYLEYNSDADSYVYGGSIEFKFDIVENEHISL